MATTSPSDQPAAPAGEDTAATVAATGTGSKVGNLVIRPLVLAFVFVCLVFAVLQASGRIVMAVLHVFEADFNVLLADQNIRVHNLRGHWQGFNPVIEIEALSAPAFQAANVTFELDLLESIWHNGVVAHRLSIPALEMRAEKSDIGWAIRGLGGENNFDVELFLRHSDAVDLHARLTLDDLAVDEETLAWLDAEVALRNVRAGHAASLSLTSSASSGEPQALEVAVRQTQSERISDDIFRSLRVTGSLTLPKVLTRDMEVRLTEADIKWARYMDNGDGGGVIALQVVNTLSAAPVDVTITASAGLDGDDYVFAVDPQIAVGADALTLPTVFARFDIDQLNRGGEEDLFTRLVVGAPTEPMVQVWVSRLDLDAITGLIAGHFAKWEPAGRWIAGLNLSGSADNLHAYVDAEGRFGYAASLSDLSMQGYRGAPTLTNGQAQVWGYANSVALSLNAQDAFLHFPDLYHEGWQFEHLSGVMKGWFGPGYFALEGDSIKAQTKNSAIASSFSLSRPDPRYEQRLGMLLNLDHSDLAQARTFIPYKIPPDLAKWLESGPKSGHLFDALFAYQGQVHVRPGELGRRIELVGDLREAAVRYEPNWPLVEDLDAYIHVAGATTRIKAREGTSMNLDMGGSDIELRENGLYATGILNVDGSADDLLEFIRISPLQETLSFVKPDWLMQGQVKARGPITVPLRDEGPELAVGFDFQIADVDLDMPEFRTELRKLGGTGRFDLPHHVTGVFRGEMFDQPTIFTANHTEHQVSFDITGVATPDDVYKLIAYEDTVPISGQFNFKGKLRLPMQVDHPGADIPSLNVLSDLTGLQIDLPAEFGKARDAAAETELDVQFLDDYQAIRWEYKSTLGWLHFAEELERGAIGINANPPMTSTDTQAIVISGQMPRAMLSDWVSDQGESSVSLPLDWDIRGLHLDEFVIDELAFGDVNLSGSQVGDNVWFSFEAEDLAGAVEIPAQGTMNIALSRLRLPVLDEEGEEESEGTSTLASGEVSPAAQAVPAEFIVGVEVGESLPAAKVSIDKLFLEQEPFGSWSFEMVPEVDTQTGLNSNVAFTGFTADVNGVHIKDAHLTWSLPDNVSSFVGDLTLDNLEETLPLWEYPAALSTTNASLGVDGSWRGSPIDISLLGLTGTLGFAAEEGRFLELDAGAGGLRMLSLVNFSKAAKRFRFDFSEVVGEVISFDTLSAKVSLQEGHLTFDDRLRLKGSSGAYQFGGMVDLRGGTLDNEMIVTLPVSNSLPWYGVYLALANPLAGLGVVVGERVLRKPLEQFSSAKFSVTGTLDEPEINFVSLWDQSMKETTLDEVQVPPNGESGGGVEQGSGG